MGNTRSRSSDVKASAMQVRVLCGNGVIEVFKIPTKARDVMARFPGCWVCHAEAFFIGKPLCAIPRDEELKGGQAYFVLPRKTFKQGLTSSKVVSLISNVSPNNSQNSPHQGSKPFKIMKKGRALQVKFSPNFLAGEGRRTPCCGYGAHAHAQEVCRIAGGNNKGICDSFQLMSDYANLVKPAVKPWKPKLSTIRETSSSHHAKALLVKMLNPVGFVSSA